MAIGGTELRRLSEKNPEAFDPYWTHLIYFNSKRELMSGSALINADVKGNLSGEYFRKGFTKDFMGEFFKEMRRRLDNVKELTSRIESSTDPEILETLFIKSINNDKNNFKAYNNLGVLMYKLFKFKEAESYYYKAI